MMKLDGMLAAISRSFFKKHGVYRYRMKKIADMSDEECIEKCHWYCEENSLVEEFEAFRALCNYRYCRYLSQYIEEGLCCDIQMIAGGYIHASALPDCRIDAERAGRCCEGCAHTFG